MKLFYLLCLFTTVCFGQIGTEKLTNHTWYLTDRNGKTTTYSSVKSHKKSNYYIQLKKDGTFKIPYSQRRRCPTGEKPFFTGTWQLKTIDNTSFLIMDFSNRTAKYSILYANLGVLKLHLLN